ncbi:conserved hypothetical protein [Vibrio nigripulchritudo POn4]|uniref:hypothetical protein n=1 Tax=Vibrio nigripulchritudo TaxID=28173 RepID=UPI0003B213A5|nr:hypothetical protein [Vibrio nigripulchritudo]CCN63549.1 conserved hypothetical protein [Vibrio nigripulchritudo POn4]
MLEREHNSSLETFWYDLNLKLMANAQFRYEKGNVNDDVFFFEHYKGLTELDFTVFDLQHVQIQQAARVTIDCQSYPLSLKEYAKITVVHAISSGDVLLVRTAYKFLIHVGAYLNSIDHQFLSLQNLEGFHISFLTQSVTPKGLFSRLSPESYAGTYGRFCFIKSRNELELLGVSGVLGRCLTKKNFSSALDSACQTSIGMCLGEYKQGGSFNYLGLELGQYYIDYMRRVYEADYLYALVCLKAIDAVSEQFNLNKLKYNECRWHLVILDSVLGRFIANKKKQNMPITRNKIHRAFKTQLCKFYSQYFDRVESLREENIHSVVKALNLEMRFDAFEVIRIVMLQKYYPFICHKSPDLVWKSYLSSLDKTDINTQHLHGTSVSDVYRIMSERISLKRLDDQNFLCDLEKWSSVLMSGQDSINYKSFQGELERISGAMTSLVVAWLGYRQSEFGFPIKAIYVEPNLDILDSSYVPFRFKLKWLVPKTNASVKIEREITSQCYQLAVQLHDLFDPAESAPCLYKKTGGHKRQVTSNESGSYISTRISLNWFSFVKNYPPFIEASELKSLSSKELEKLTKEQLERLNWLKHRYDLSSARTQKLIETHLELTSDLDRLMCSSFAGSRLQKKFKNSLLEMNQTGCISNPKHLSVVERYLSVETKNWLQSQDLYLDPKNMMDINKEILQGVRYPTSHAFRHIWAEAVLNRYQGNIGAVIQHQFCHLDESFFMAYLRDKEPQELIKLARMKILNSVIDTLIVESGKLGQEYLGGFSRYVKKIVQLTRTASGESIDLKALISERIISIQPSYFATCIPRESRESRAKCAKFGELTPHNAKPEFCLNCTYALITGSNLKGIWLTLQPFVKEALNERVLGVMVSHHLPTLRSGYKRIKELRTEGNANNVDIILGSISSAIDTIERKLKTEGM